MIVPSFKQNFAHPTHLSAQSITYTHSTKTNSIIPQAVEAPATPPYTVIHQPTYQQSYVQPSAQLQNSYISSQPSTQVQIQKSIEYPSKQTIEYTYPVRVAPSVQYNAPQQNKYQEPRLLPPPYYPPTVPQHQQSYQPTVPQHQQSYQSTMPQLQHQPYPQYQQPYSNSASLDMFGSYNKHHNSLLSSYVPSSVILEKQRALNMQQNQPSSSTSGLASYSNTPDANISRPNPINTSGYNTIAYSTPQHYNFFLKRSPKAPSVTAAADAVQSLPQKTTKLVKITN